MEHKKIIIIGGGIAGISCALKLKEAGEDFLLVTERLGGRIYYSDEEKVNYGAYFVMDNYRHVKKILKKTTGLSKINAQFHNSEDDCFTLISLKTLRLIPQLLRFAFAMIIFAIHFEKYKKSCESMPVREALELDPYMRHIFDTPASDFIARHGFGDANREFFSKFSYACTAVPAEKINALDYLTLSMGLLLPIHRFVFDNAGMAGKFNKELVVDSVTGITQKKDLYTLTTKSGRKFSCDYAVVATEGSVTKKLLHLPFVRKSYLLQVYHVRGALKEKYARYTMNLFAEKSKIIAITMQDDRSYLVFASTKDSRYLDACFKSYEIIGSVTWEKALYTEGKEIVDEQFPAFGKNLYIAGEHNCVGMEPSAISGIFAANRILSSVRSVGNPGTAEDR
ncbi:MAG TPA: NAD(P)-binding protein [Spirochaetota bacterium]|nr:NAD(P)-binding protein [Spirochaetota bacterium]HOD15275.1 NAD(P)-binding protein [Spirochaetota bacterium]HPG51046.1 NAD(P)-binding protein [Spirochaetota bacterium]HPN12036.1 NAD(P)-binding protein [Spirochaetota bacterium]